MTFQIFPTSPRRTKKHISHSWALNFHVSPFFLDSDTCQIFSCLKKFFLDKILCVQYGQKKLRIISFRALYIGRNTIFSKIKMKLDVDMSIFWGFGLIFVLKRSISFSNFNRTMEPDQSILIRIKFEFLFFDCTNFEVKIFCWDHQKFFYGLFDYV